uniref:Uncharacterized protein n=1 Tax=Arundo donax TaxID=35708 RepID=A0A0A9F2Y2_ARUDO
MVRSMQDGEPKSKASAQPIAGMRQGEREAGPHLPGEALAQRDPQALAVPGDRQHQLAAAAVRSMAAWWCLAVCQPRMGCCSETFRQEW